jgi:aquaporin Z
VAQRGRNQGKSASGRPAGPVKTQAAASDIAPTERRSTGARFAAEAFGTFLLVTGTIGTALFSAGVPDAGVGYLGVALAVGLTIVAGGYSVGHISGGHFNPAVTLGLGVAGRIEWRAVPAYLGAQVLGGLVGSTLLFAIAAGGPAGGLAKLQDAGFASNGYDARSPGGFGLGSVMLAELVLTFVFVLVILGITDKPEVSGFAPLAIGLTLTLIHLASIPISNTSVNPARSIATAVYGGLVPLGQLWVFILVPIVGGVLAGFAYKPLFGGR